MCHVTPPRVETVCLEKPQSYLITKDCVSVQSNETFLHLPLVLCEISFSRIPRFFFFFNSTNIAIHVFLLASLAPISPLKLWRVIQINCSEHLLMSAKMRSWRISWEGPHCFGGVSWVFIWQSLYRLQRHCLPWHQFSVWLKFPKCCFVSKQWDTGSEWELPCSLWDKLGEKWNVTEPFCLVPFTLF